MGGPAAFISCRCRYGKNRSPAVCLFLAQALERREFERVLLRLAVLGADYGFFRAIWGAITIHRAQRRGLERVDDNSDLEDEDDDDDEDGSSDADA